MINYIYIYIRNVVHIYSSACNDIGNCCQHSKILMTSLYWEITLFVHRIISTLFVHSSMDLCSYLHLLFAHIFMRSLFTLCALCLYVHVLFVDIFMYCLLIFPTGYTLLYFHVLFVGIFMWSLYFSVLFDHVSMCSLFIFPCALCSCFHVLSVHIFICSFFIFPCVLCSYFHVLFIFPCALYSMCSLFITFPSAVCSYFHVNETLSPNHPSFKSIFWPLQG